MMKKFSGYTTLILDLGMKIKFRCYLWVEIEASESTLTPRVRVSGTSNFDLFPTLTNQRFVNSMMSNITFYRFIIRRPKTNIRRAHWMQRVEASYSSYFIYAIACSCKVFPCSCGNFEEVKFKSTVYELQHG